MGRYFTKSISQSRTFAEVDKVQLAALCNSLADYEVSTKTLEGGSAYALPHK